MGDKTFLFVVSAIWLMSAIIATDLMSGLIS